MYKEYAIQLKPQVSKYDLHLNTSSYNKQFENYSTASSKAHIASTVHGADGVPLKSLILGIDAYHDLHGYTKPWPAGGSNNLLDEASLGNGYINEDTGIDESKDQYTRSGFIPINANTVVYLTVRISDMRFYWYNASYEFLSSIAVNSSSGWRATSPANAAYLRVAGFDAAFEGHIMLSYTENDSYKPYANRCEVVSWNALTLYRSGANLLNRDACINGYIDENGVLRNNNDWRHTPLIPVNGGETVYFSGNYNLLGSSTMRVHGYDKSGVWKEQLGYQQVSSYQPFDFNASVTDGVAYIVASFHNDTSNVNLALTDSRGDYNGSAYTIELPPLSLFCGAVIDVATGTMTVTHDYLVSNADGTFDYYHGGKKSIALVSYNSGNDYAYISLGTQGQQSVSSGAITICDRLAYAGSGVATSDNTFRIRIPTEADDPSQRNRFHRITFRMTSIPNWGSGAAAITSYLQSQYQTPMQFAIQLADPVILTLSPIQIQSLLNDNYVYAMADSVLPITTTAVFRCNSTV